MLHSTPDASRTHNLLSVSSANRFVEIVSADIEMELKTLVSFSVVDNMIVMSLTRCDVAVRGRWSHCSGC